MKDHPTKNAPGPKDASSAYMFFIRLTELGSLYGSLSVYTEIIVLWGGGFATPPPSDFELAISPAHRSKIDNFYAHRLARADW